MDYLIFSAIPLSAIGGVLSLWLRGMNFSISAGVGFIALFGVAVLNGIVLISEFNDKKKTYRFERRGENWWKNQIETRFNDRFCGFTFLPMALSNGEGAEVQRPLATVVIGGLLLATFLTFSFCL
jgi:cobalt-zinc-cadmium resistance protein CzcA